MLPRPRSNTFSHKKLIIKVGVNSAGITKERFLRPLFFIFFLDYLENSIIHRTFAPPEPAKPLDEAQMCGSFSKRDPGTLPVRSVQHAGPFFLKKDYGNRSI